ncbi:MAG: histidine kinase [Actinomycetota bacterium]
MALRAKTASRLAWSLFGLFLAFAAAGLFLITRNRGSFGDDALIVVGVASLPIVGALIASRRPENPIGWLLIWVACGASFMFVCGEYALLALRDGVGPRWLGLAAAVISNSLWSSTFLLLPTFVVLLYPTGRLPSPRWRPVAWGIAVAIGFALLITLLTPSLEPFDDVGLRIDNPIGVEALEPYLSAAEQVLFPVLMLGIVLSLASMVVRYRRAAPDERQPMRLFLFAAIVAAASWAMAESLSGVLSELVFWGGTLSLSGAIAVGILRYRLYEIDLVIRKTLVYGVLFAMVTAAYLALVMVLIPAAVLGPDAAGQNFLVIIATVLVTLGLLPLRRRALRLANHLVYGKRATPYEVLSEFSGRVGGVYATEDVLPRMARVLAEGTGAARAEVLLRDGPELRLAATWPPDGPGEGDPDVVVPVVDRGEELGALSVRKGRGEPLTPAEQKLVRDLAGQAGLVLRNVRLLEDLRASRKRLVAAQDAERRRLERDIHDGAQQQLVALAVKLRLLETLTEKDPVRAKSMAADLKTEATDALENLRDLARGIYPPLLADEGLAAALSAQARKAGVPVVVHPDGVGRYAQETEAAVYFCVLEALQNAAKYAAASRAEVRVSDEGGHLRFEVADDGRGFDPATTARGSGLQNMSDRLEALGGSLVVTSAPGEGTTVTGRVPVEMGR